MPANKKIFGWGREEWSWQKNIFAEKIEHETNLRLYGEELFSRPAEKEVNPIEEQLLNSMPWDKGWDFTYAEKIVYGRELKRGPQNIGNCVGYSHCLLLATKIAHEILVEGDLEERLGEEPVPYIPYSYGAGRCLEGNMCGGGDGSYCSVQIRASMEHGFLRSNTPGLNDPEAPQGSIRTGRQWGSSRQILNKWRPQAVAYDLEHSYEINSEEDAWKAIVVDKQPFQICSNWGFRSTSEFVDINGWKFRLHRAGGTWPHSMQVLAAFETDGGDRFYKIGNQWGNYHRGVDGNEWWFVITDDVMSDWLRKADARTIGEIKGSPTDLTL